MRPTEVVQFLDDGIEPGYGNPYPEELAYRLPSELQADPAHKYETYQKPIRFKLYKPDACSNVSDFIESEVEIDPITGELAWGEREIALFEAAVDARVALQARLDHKRAKKATLAKIRRKNRNG